MFRALPNLARLPTRAVFNPDLILCKSGSTRSYCDAEKPVKTLELQNRLEKLPVPDLKETLAKFLRTAQPHLTAAEFAGSCKNIRIHRGDGESVERFAWVVFWGVGIFSVELCPMSQILDCFFLTRVCAADSRLVQGQKWRFGSSWVFLTNV